MMLGWIWSGWGGRDGAGMVCCVGYGLSGLLAGSLLD